MAVWTISNSERCDPQKIPRVRLQPCYRIYGQIYVVNRYIPQRHILGNVIRNGLIIDCRVNCGIDNVWGPGVEDAIST